MREIKFRVWDKKEKQWLKYKKIHIGWQIPIDKDPIKIDGYFFVSKDGEVCSDLEYCIQNKNFELMQYTGLKDKNDKEIYEGDIVVGKDGHYRPFKGAVEFKSEWGRMVVIDEDLTLTFGIAKKCEILGNLYENPELLDLCPSEGEETKLGEGNAQ